MTETSRIETVKGTEMAEVSDCKETENIRDRGCRDTWITHRERYATERESKGTSIVNRQRLQRDRPTQRERDKR